MRIRRLSEGTVNRIAAGEVIERPASVVKELVENAVDAGAGQIDVAFRGGGKSLIRVSDDGIGMGPEDLALAVERHATSKLSDDDLIDIRFLGFRGEALPSIGSVSRLSITSRPCSGGDAHVITVEGGHLTPPRPAALNLGTEIDVKDTLKKKIGVDFRRYRILGACNPKLAHEALQLEGNIGTMLPCNVVVQEKADGGIEVAAIDPVASMMAVDNPRLKQAAEQVRDKLQRVVSRL